MTLYDTILRRRPAQWLAAGELPLPGPHDPAVFGPQYRQSGRVFPQITCQACGCAQSWPGDCWQCGGNPPIGN